MATIIVWYLENCSTCQRILKELHLNSENAKLINIKEKNITKEELELIQKTLHCSYEELFNKRAIKFKDLKNILMSNDDYKRAILNEYTFLKRPVIQVGNNFFVGNSRKVTEQTKQEILKN